MNIQKLDFFIPPGEILKQYIDSNNYSLEAFAAQCNVSEKHLTNIIYGEVEISVNDSIAFSKFLNVTEDYFYNLQQKYLDFLKQ